MKIMPCPLNGPRNIQEFVCGGPVEPHPDPNRCSDREWTEFVWMEENVAGVVREWWCHVATAYWFIAERNTVTDEILATYPADRVFSERVEFEPLPPPPEAAEAKPEPPKEAPLHLPPAPHRRPASGRACGGDRAPADEAEAPAKNAAPAERYAGRRQACRRRIASRAQGPGRMMARLPEPAGLLLDRTEPIAFRFEGKRYEGYRGDTVASALAANDVSVLSRSFKYHRPRGIHSLSGLDANALVQVGPRPTASPSA